MTGIGKTGRLSRNILLIPLIVIVAACSSGESDKVLLDRAKDYLESRDINAAALELKNILQKNANHAEARYLLGQISLDLGNMKAAQKEMRRALAAGWDEAVTQRALAEIMYRQGYFQKVLDDIKIKDSYPDMVKANLTGLWALSEASLGKWDDAEQTIRTGESITGDSLWLLQSKIQLAIHRKEMSAAGKILEHALKAYPDSQDLWLISAGLAEQSGELTNTINALQKAIDLDPPRNVTALGRQARLAQGQAWLKQQDFAKAKAVIDPVLKNYPGDPLANYLAAIGSFKQGEDDQTEEHLLLALKAVPEHRPSLLLFGALSYARDDYEKAAYYLEKAAALQPEDIGAQTLLGKTYLMLGQYDEAENRLKYASSKMGDDAELLALLGISRLRGGVESGMQQLEKAAAAAPADQTIRSELARAYLDSGETAMAIRELESALEGNGQEYRTELLLVVAYLRASEFDKALELASRLSEQHTDNPMPHILAGAAYEGKQDFSAARLRYDAAIGVQSDNIMAMRSLARLDLRDGNVDMARKRYHSVLKIQPGNAAAMVALSKILMQEGKTEEAIAQLEEAREVDQKALEPRLILSKYYRIKGKTEKALDYANEALKIAPQNSYAMWIKGLAQLAAGKSESVQTLQKLAEKMPDYAKAHYYLAEARLRFGDITGARQSLQTVLTLEPDHELALLASARIEMREGKADKALKISQKMIKVRPEAATGYMLKGDVLMAGGKKKSALKAYQQALAYATNGKAAIKISGAQAVLGDTEASYKTLQSWLKQHPEDMSVRFALATSYLANGKKDAAISQYEIVLEKQPDNPAALNDLAWLYHERGDQRALKMAEKAYRLAPDSPAVQDTYGWILIQNGRIEFGLVALEQAVSNAPHSLEIRYHLAVALTKAGEKTRAKEELKLILQSGKPFSDRASAKALLAELE